MLSGRRLLRLLLPPLILSLAVGGFIMLRVTRSATPPVQVEEKAWRVSTMSVDLTRHSPNVLLYGTVEAPRRAELSAAVNADVLQVLISEGHSVQAGQTLVILDQREVDLNLRQRQADVAEIQAMITSEQQRYRSDKVALKREQALLELSRKAVLRAEDLNRRKMGSQSLLDEARQAQERQALSLNTRQLAVDEHPARMAQLKAKLARAQALRDQAKLDQERTQIRAPFNARVARLPVAVGDRVRVGDLLVEVYGNDDLEIRAQFPFRYLPVVRAGLDQDLTAVAQIDGRSLSAVLDRLVGETATAGGGQDALFRVLEGNEALVPGRLVALQVELPPQEQVAALPPDALYGFNRVYRLEQGRMQGLAVERIGERRNSDGGVSVLVRGSDLRSGDLIITTQLPNAVTGLKVTTAD